MPIYMAKKAILETKISILKEVADTLVSTDNIDSITTLILDLALTYTRAKTGSILLLNEKGELTLRAARGMDTTLMTDVKIKIGEDICGKVALEQKPLLVKDIEQDERIREKRKQKYETKSFICCPIIMKDKPLGVINVNDKIDGTPFNEDEFDLVNVLANQSAIALENGRLMSELRSKAIELDELNKWLIEADRLKTEFVAKMSHELRTPLNAIKGAIYYLKEKRVISKVEQKEFIEIISDETNKLSTFTDELVDFSRLGREERVIKKRVLNLNDVIKDVIVTKTVNDLSRDKKVSVLNVCPEHIPEIVGDRTRIFQLFINLIEGLAKYTIPGDLIEIKASEVEPAIEVELFVKGRKIPDGELPFIFDSRALWSKRGIPSDNLKFYLAKKTVELHKGTISAQNTPDGFSIKLSIPTSVKEKRDAEINELMNLFISFIADSMNLNKCSLMLSDELTGELTIRSAQGLDEEIIRSTRLRPGDKIAGWVAIEKKPLLIEDVEKDPNLGKKSQTQYSTKSLLSLPLIVNDRVLGVLNLNNKERDEPFNRKDLYLATAITQRIAHMIGKLYKGELKEGEFKMITKGMESLLNACRKYKKKDERLSDLVVQIMRHLQCSEEEICLALYVSIIYDLGMAQIEESILKKPHHKLTALEQRIIKTHPFSGMGLINCIEPDEMVHRIILHHHERYDGSGYPDGLKGDNIPIISRVLAIVDTYVAMTTDKPYRKAIPKEKAIELIRVGAGAQFDPEIVETFVKIES